MAKEPGYCRHKPTNQAYIRLDGKPYYLGEYGSELSKERYNRLKAEWLSNRHSKKFQPKSSTGPTVSDICHAYLDHAEVYYSASKEYKNLELACGPLSELYATLPAKDFGIPEFEACREWWLKPGTRCRQYINRQMKRLIRILSWSAGKGMIPAAICQTLREVPILAPGRTKAKEAVPIGTVAQSIVNATLPCLTPIVADMVRLQQLLACRPGEICGITPAMVNKEGDVWTITLVHHKNAWRGHSRILYAGPKSQAILVKYLKRDENAYCFSPAESEVQRLAIRHEARTTRMSCGNRPGSNVARKPRRVPGNQYTAESYGKAIKYACQRAKVAVWSPNQLRHNAATILRKSHGLEVASIALGHSDMKVTEIYAEADNDKAVEIARLVG
jgi:integrase